jgi:hypothetical protein
MTSLLNACEQHKIEYPGKFEKHDTPSLWERGQGERPPLICFDREKR